MNHDNDPDGGEWEGCPTYERIMAYAVSVMGLVACGSIAVLARCIR
jgi:hypothetical protein